LYVGSFGTIESFGAAWTPESAGTLASVQDNEDWCPENSPLQTAPSPTHAALVWSSPMLANEPTHHASGASTIRLGSPPPRAVDDLPVPLQHKVKRVPLPLDLTHTHPG
jgi:hypothetical protein